MRNPDKGSRSQKKGKMGSTTDSLGDITAEDLEEKGLKKGGVTTKNMKSGGGWGHRPQARTQERKNKTISKTNQRPSNFVRIREV